MDNGLTKEEIYKKLSKRITVNVGKQDKLLNIATQAKSPEAAQKLNQALLDTLFPLSKPRGLEKSSWKYSWRAKKSAYKNPSNLNMTLPPILHPAKA